MHGTRKIAAQAVSQADEQVPGSAQTLCFIRNTPKLATNHVTLAAGETMDIIPRKPFNVLSFDFSSC